MFLWLQLNTCDVFLFASGIKVVPEAQALHLGHKELLQVGGTLVVLGADLVVWAAVENDAPEVGQEQSQAGVVARMDPLGHGRQI